MTTDTSITAQSVIPAALIDQAKSDAAPAPAPGAAPAVPINWPKEGRELIDFTLTLLSPLSPSLAGVYPEAVRAQLAEHIGRVLEKYGLDMAALFGKWAPELGLAICAAPLIAPTVQAIRTDRAARAAAPAPAAPGAAPVPAAAPLVPVAPAEKPAGPSDLQRFPGAEKK
jgi:pyruvate dehydrogenase E2 component (dihydrolipoamide acetyltransferase)